MTQSERTRKYLDSNHEAKEKHRISGYKSKDKKFILEFASEEDLLQVEEWIKQSISHVCHP
ncbi:hypothetical protein HCQ94_05045 [Actinomyces sp. zg-332]|uniref:hypothetical protein n=1 Tax=Actinomyces sp. zg-332 TaxID=2708340 RepID=UPI001420F97A|nr:hypothetical protein [Actinomyces sp. zg-332]QPK93942.1 hypothetical protein HCQ94_05045 [Actinomyces sp. zg-332]